MSELGKRLLEATLNRLEPDSSAERIGKSLADSGASQGRVLALLRSEHQVSMGAERLRKIASAVSAGMEPFRQTCQIDSLLEALRMAQQNPLPQLAYVADSGGNESSYFEQSLRRMRHPRTGQRLDWQRVVDYYHVAERIWTMADCLFGKETRAGTSWAKRMLTALKKPSGPSRVLHSAASLFKLRKPKKSQAKNFWTAYRYLRKRTRFLNYHQYAAKHIPLGSGVTEAACKTIYTQRLKLSGMRWTQSGAAMILNLRTILLSRTWDATFNHYLQSINPASLRPYAPPNIANLKIAA